MIKLKIPDIGELRLDFNESKKFSMCKFSYKDKEREIDMCEDYLYIFVENMFGRVQNIPTVEEMEMWGKMGKWQEYFYYDSSDIELHSKEISLMKKSLFVSTESYGTFLYKHNEYVWLEINKGYNEECNLSPIDFYNNPANYRISFMEIPNKALNEWKSLLSGIQEEYRV